MKRVLRSRRSALLAAAIAIAVVGAPSAAHAAPVLTVKPLTWNVIGLDSNSPATGPDLFPVGARVCNTGNATATAVSSQLAWDSANAYINVDGSNTITVGDIAPNACADAYFHVRVTKNAAAFDTTRAYHVTASSSGTADVSTPSGRELYVEHLISQNRNSVNSVTSSAIDVPPTSTTPAHATVFLGHTYTFTVNAKTATGGYEQLEAFESFLNPMFRITGVQATYAQPSGATNTSVYADACGWDNVVGSPTYRSCIGPANYTGAKAGGNPITVTYTVVATATGSGTLQALIYDFSGSSFHYNSDFMSATSQVAVDVIKAPDLSVTSSHTPLTEGQPATYTIDVTNVGQAPTTGPITVTDTLPTGVTYTGASGSGWSCNAVGQVVTCTSAGPIAPGVDSPIAINVTVDQNPPASITNNVTVSNTSDDNSANDSASDQGTVDRVPHAANDSATTAQDTPVTVDVLGNDGGGDGSLTVTGHTTPGHGGVTCSTTDCTYTPDPGYSGSDTFDYTVTDSNGSTATATVTVSIAPAVTTTTTVPPTTTTVAPTTTVPPTTVPPTTVPPTTVPPTTVPPTTVPPTTVPPTTVPPTTVPPTTVPPTTVPPVTLPPTTSTTVAPTTTTTAPSTTTTTAPTNVKPISVSTTVPPTTTTVKPTTTTTAPKTTTTLPTDPPKLQVSAVSDPPTAISAVLATTGGQIIVAVAFGLLFISGGCAVRVAAGGTRRRTDGS